MLRLTDDQPSLWESVLPPDLFRMSEELAEVDRWLDDERFFAPFRERFATRVGRPTIPVATYLRMMYLKRRYGLGYETLVKEVHDSFTWRRFCRLSLEERVPDATTLIKLSHKYGDDTLRDLNDALVLKLKEQKVIRGKKLRIDTTVTEANIHYPTDTSRCSGCNSRFVWSHGHTTRDLSFAVVLGDTQMPPGMDTSKSAI
ncbi:MAG: transposase [Chloroflexi bacterium]|nr:transposase [Chloroflexota bacterium]